MCDKGQCPKMGQLCVKTICTFLYFFTLFCATLTTINLFNTVTNYESDYLFRRKQVHNPVI